MTRTGGQYQVIVTHAPSVSDHLLASSVDPRHFRKHGPDISLFTEDAANGRGNISRRKRGRCDLIKQGLKQMVVVAIDQRDVERSVRKTFSSRQPAKAAANNYNSGFGPCAQVAHSRLHACSLPLWFSTLKNSASSKFGAFVMRR